MATGGYRRFVWWLALIICVVCSAPASAESVLRGIVRHASGRVVPDAVVIVENDREQQWTTTTTAKGAYEVRGLTPGTYQVAVYVATFEPFSVSLEVGTGRLEPLNILLHLRLRDTATITVPSQTNEFSPPGDGAVGTVITADLLNTMPLSNGQTLQSLHMYVPGIVYTQQTGNLAQFTAVGARRLANQLDVDGMNMNLGLDLVGRPTDPAGSGALPAVATSGSTQTLVPLAAADEIAIRTTNTSAEHGRASGAQTSIVTRSGGDRFSATGASEWRPRGWTGRDWFEEHGKTPKRWEELSNVTGGVGSPILSGRLWQYTAFDYQRLGRPVQETISVPSMAVREGASEALRGILNAWPQPNGPETGGGLADFTGEFPASSRMTSLSVRLDGNLSTSHRVWTRVNRGRSEGNGLSADLRPRMSFTDLERTRTLVATGGVTSILSSRAVHDVRVNVSRHSGDLIATNSPLGGAQPLPLSSLAPSSNAEVGIVLFPGPHGSIIFGPRTAGFQEQFQILDTLTVVRQRHEWKVGVDFRHVLSGTDPPSARYLFNFGTINPFLQGRMAGLAIDRLKPTRATRQTTALFLQDTWRASSRLTLTAGVRAAIQPAPSSATDLEPALVSFEKLPVVEPRPAGAPLWRTPITFAPRVSAAYQLRTSEGRETTLRAGWALAVDEIINPGISALTRGLPSTSGQFYGPQPFPVPLDTLDAPPALINGYTEQYAFPETLKPPRTHQWHLGIDRAFGRRQRMSFVYVGAAGRDQLYWYTYQFGPSFDQRVHAFDNLAESDYRAGLFEYTGDFGRLNARVTYTLGRSEDTDSGEAVTPNQPPSVVPMELNRGVSDYDRTHILHVVASYELPAPRLPSWLGRVTSGWNLDVVGIMQSGIPFSVTTTRDLGYGHMLVRPDLVLNVPLWVPDPTSPTGRRVNERAFEEPTDLRQGTARRNLLRSSPLRQVDLVFSRWLTLSRGLRAQVRFEVYNALNTVNTGSPETLLGIGEEFGLPSLSYADSLGRGTLLGGGLTPILQSGGPRAFQLAIRLGL